MSVRERLVARIAEGRQRGEDVTQFEVALKRLPTPGGAFGGIAVALPRSLPPRAQPQSKVRRCANCGEPITPEDVRLGDSAEVVRDGRRRTVHVGCIEEEQGDIIA